MNVKERRAEITRLFLNKRYSAYAISMEMNVSISEVYDCISTSEEAKKKHQLQLKKTRETSVLA